MYAKRMTKPFQAIIMFGSALLFLSLIGITQCQNDRFFVEGDVYCDTCRAQFLTRLSEPMSGAKVKLECRDRSTEHVVYSREGETDKNGKYSVPIDGDREDDICEVGLVKSSRPGECDEMSNNFFTKETSRVTVTSNNGMLTPVRKANPLFFLKKEALPGCIEVFKELNYLPS